MSVPPWCGKLGGDRGRVRGRGNSGAGTEAGCGAQARYLGAAAQALRPGPPPDPGPATRAARLAAAPLTGPGPASRVVRLGPAGRPGRGPARRGVRPLPRDRLGVRPVGGGLPRAVPARRFGGKGALGPSAARTVGRQQRARGHGAGQRAGLRCDRRWGGRRRSRAEPARLRLPYRDDIVERRPDGVPGERVDRLGPGLARRHHGRRDLWARRGLACRGGLRQFHGAPDPLVRRCAVRRGGGCLPAGHGDRRAHRRHRLQQPDGRRAVEHADGPGTPGLAGGRAGPLRHRGGTAATWAPRR